jgi:hypothetical protein
MAIYQITCYAPATLEQSKKGYQCQAWEYEVQAATAEEAFALADVAHKESGETTEITQKNSMLISE